jgi:hypothetical protein
MAYLAQDNEDEQKNPAQGAVAPAGGGIPTGVASGVGGTTTPGASASKTPTGGSFATLQTYLGANQGQAPGIANTITNKIGDQYNTLQTGNDSTLQGLNSAVDQGYTKQNQAVLDQEAANPVSFASNSGNVQNFQGQLNDKYTGPQSAESDNGFQTQSANVNKAITSGQQSVGTDAGRTGLVQDASRDKTTGVTALNNAVLNSDNGALNQVEQAYKPFSNLTDQLNTGAQNVDTNIGNATTQANNASTAANKAIADQTGTLNSAVQGQLDNANTTNANTVNTYNGLVDTLSHAQNSLSDAQIQALGLTREQADALQHQGALANQSGYETGHNFGAASATQDINNDAYLKQFATPFAPTANQVATGDQFNTLNALLTLNNGQTPTGALLDPTQAAQAGTYVAPSLKGSLDYAGALGNSTTVEQQERQAAQDQANQLTAAADAAHDASKSHTFGGELTKILTTGGEYLANPLSTVPAQVSGAKKLASKI